MNRIIINALKNNLIWILIGIFFILYFLHSFLNYQNFYNHAWDLGIYHQQIWRYGHFYSAFNTVRGINLLSDHFGLILYPIGWIYLIYPRTETILFIQTLLVVLSAYPLWKIAKHFTKSTFFGLTIAFLFLSSLGVQSAIDFDFHLATIAVFFYAYFVYFLWKKQWLWASLFAFLSVITKEDMPIYLAFASLSFLGITIFNRRQQEKEVFKPLFLFLLFSILAWLIISWLMPRLCEIENCGYFSFSYFGKNYSEVVKNLIFHPINFVKIMIEQFITNPIKTSVFLTYMKAFSWLPLLAPQLFLAAIPFLLIKFASDREALWGLTGQYSVVGMFILSLATIYAVKNLQGLKRFFKFIVPILSIILLAMSIKINWLNNSFWNVFDSERWQSTRNYQGLNQIIRQIPTDASVVTQDQILPHLSNRPGIYLAKCIYCHLSPDNHYDYLLFDSRFDMLWTPDGARNIESTIEELQGRSTFENKGKYTLIIKDEQKNHTTYLFKNVQ